MCRNVKLQCTTPHCDAHVHTLCTCAATLATHTHCDTHTPAVSAAVSLCVTMHCSTTYYNTHYESHYATATHTPKHTLILSMTFKRVMRHLPGFGQNGSPVDSIMSAEERARRAGLAAARAAMDARGLALAPTAIPWL